MTITINGTTGITNDGGYTGDGVVFADTTPANTLVTTTGGNVGIGTVPGVKLDVRGPSGGVLLNIQENDSGNNRRVRISNSGTVNTIESTTGVGSTQLAFSVDGFERARIDSSGNLLVGTTSPAPFSQNTIVGPSTGSTLALAVVHNGTSGGNVRGFLTKASNFSGNDGILYVAARSTGDVAYQFSNGNWVNINNSYGVLSDIKLKENIVDATDKLADVMSLRVRNYNLKKQPGEKQIGFIAQEFEQVFPGLVEETPDLAQDGQTTDEKTKSIKTSVLVPILVKAIQEQQAIILAQESALNALTARVAALDARLTSLEGTQP